VSPETASFEEWSARQLQDPEFRSAVEELEPAYQVIRRRALLGLTQEELAERVGTTQSSIARLESGRAQPSLSFLRRVADALGAQLQVSLVSRDELQPVAAGKEVSTLPNSEWAVQGGIPVIDWPIPQTKEVKKVVIPTVSTASDSCSVSWRLS